MHRATPVEEGRSTTPGYNRRVKGGGDLSSRIWSLAKVALFYCCLVAIQTGFFVYYKQISYKLVIYSLLPGILLGISLSFFEWSVSLLKVLTAYYMGRLLAGFVLFFVYLIGYILFFSFVVANPLDHIIRQSFGSVELSRDYGLYSVNSIIVLALLSWLKWLRGISGCPSQRTDRRGG